MTANDAKTIMLDALDSHLDERANAQGKVVSEQARRAGREAMEQFLHSSGVDFRQLAATCTPDGLRSVAQQLIRAGLS